MNKETKELLIEGLNCLLVKLKETATKSDLEDTEALKKIVKAQELKASLDSKKIAE